MFPIYYIYIYCIQCIHYDVYATRLKGCYSGNVNKVGNNVWVNKYKK